MEKNHDVWVRPENTFLGRIISCEIGHRPWKNYQIIHKKYLLGSQGSNVFQNGWMGTPCIAWPFPRICPSCSFQDSLGVPYPIINTSSRVDIKVFQDIHCQIPNCKDNGNTFGPVGSNHGSLARARARGAGSPWTAQSLLLALGRYWTQTMKAME